MTGRSETLVSAAHHTLVRLANVRWLGWQTPRLVQAETSRGMPFTNRETNGIVTLGCRDIKKENVTCPLFRPYLPEKQQPPRREPKKEKTCGWEQTRRHPYVRPAALPMCSAPSQPSLIAKYTVRQQNKAYACNTRQHDLIIPSALSGISRSLPSNAPEPGFGSPLRSRSPVVCRGQRHASSYRGILCRLCVCVQCEGAGTNQINTHLCVEVWKAAFARKERKANDTASSEPKCDPYTVMSCAFPSSSILPSCIPSAEKNP
ncbi:uncharacterized protein BDZ83DRAFT_224055 [Colletotrichum acutatum]|uniref:Uncharacterized protein n=1 Tax=Glomerella acutata TaxID=27357 RepID=A0AAD8UT27_GLOAC|nr:uncharacterized protein BDZ83DRAFT_224055 [Colletotrichum acutatum]KAK1727253.1 hypothetical protein BDZ83DRAFT_224055 [Colletotrichum acutatum]